MSDFNIIEPITITDSILTACNVVENDEQEYVAATAYNVGDKVMVATSAANTHKTFECLEAQSAGITADLLDEDCTDISDWTDVDTGVGGGVSEVSPPGQFRLDTNTSHAGNYLSGRTINIGSPPNNLTIEIKTYFDAIGTLIKVDCFALTVSGLTWTFYALFCSDGLYIRKTGGAMGDVGTNIVKCGSSAAWQTWRFEIDKTTESAATVEVFLKEEGSSFVSQGTFDCDYEVVSGESVVGIVQYGYTNDNQVTHIDYIKIGTGFGKISSVSDTPVGNTKWLEVDSTNRWKLFNNVLGSQTTQATKIEYILTPGAVIDSVALLNLDSDTVDIVEIDNADNLITNGLDWTDATGGTTPPTGWDKVGTCSDFTIDGGMIRLTADANGEGISQTLTVSAATEYQLLGIYKNTASDVAQYAIYDATHSADIVAATDLTSSTVNSSFSKVFNTPSGCTSIKISLLCKTSGDIVWFDHIKCAPTEYSETVTTGASKTDVVKMDIPQKAAGILTVTINKSTTAKIGELIIGTKTSLGTMRYSPQIGITDYSSKSQDKFGNWTIVQRSYSKKLSCDLIITNTNLDTVFKTLSGYRSNMLVWVPNITTYSALIVYGFYSDFSIVVSYPNYSECSLEIEGMI